LRSFVLSQGRKYQELVPTDLVSPNRSGDAKGYTGWAYCARTLNKDFLLLYFENNCPRATVSGLTPKTTYHARWFDPREEVWLAAGSGNLIAGPNGRIVLPPFPDDEERSKNDWGLKLLKIGQ